MRFLFSESNQKVSQGQYLNPEPFCRRAKILDVACHKCIGLTITSRSSSCQAAHSVPYESHKNVLL